MKFLLKYPVLLIGLIILFSCYLDVIYAFVTREWLFKGVLDIPPMQFAAWKLIFSKVLLLGSLASLYFHRDHASLFVQTLTVTVLTLPNLTYYTHEEMAVFVPILAAALPWVVLLVPKLRWLPPSLPSTLPREHVLGVLSLIFVAAFAFDYGGAQHFGSLLMQNDIYEFRAQAAQETSIFTAYSFGFVISFLLPAAMLSYWYRGGKWRYLSFVFLLLGVFVYASNPHKSILFNLAVVAFFAFFKTFKSQSLAWVGLLLCIAVVGRIEATLHPDTQGYAEGFIIRRFLVLPAMLNDYYFEFFSGRPTYLAHSVMRHFLDNPFNASPSHLIGHEIYGEKVSSNNGFISDGFVSFGYFGSLVFSIIPIVLLTFLARMKKPPFFFGLIFIAFIVFRNSALLTALLTHGVAWFVFLWFFFIPSLSDE